MYCPACKGEYRAGFTECVDCHVPLVESLSGENVTASHDHTREQPRPDIELVSVLVSGDAGVVALAKSVLSSAEIEFMTRGDDIQDLFGLGRIGFNPILGGVEFLVASEDVSAAELLLADLIQDGS